MTVGKYVSTNQWGHKALFILNSCIYDVLKNAHTLIITFISKQLHLYRPTPARLTGEDKTAKNCIH